MVGKKEKRNVCVTSGFQLIMLIHRIRGVSKPAKRSSISFFSRFILPPPPLFPISSLLPSFPPSHRQPVGGKMEGEER